MEVGIINDWLWLLIQLVFMFVFFSGFWYVWHIRKVNIRKYPEIVEETNKQRIKDGKPPLIAEEIGKLLRRGVMLQSLFCGSVFSVGFSLLRWVAEKIFF